MHVLGRTWMSLSRVVLEMFHMTTILGKGMLHVSARRAVKRGNPACLHSLSQ